MIKKVIIIVLVVVALFAISQTGIFPKLQLNLFNKEVKIADTPLDITDIKDIGELITAEFCGEVYADLAETYVTILNDYSKYVATHGDTLGTYRDSLIAIYPEFEKIYNKKEKVNKLQFEIDELTKIHDLLKVNYFSQKEIDIKRENDYLTATSKFKESELKYETVKKELNDELNSIRVIERENKKALRQLKWKTKRNKEEINKIETTLSNIDENINTLLNKLNDNKSEWEKAEKEYKIYKKQYDQEKKDYSKTERSFDRENSKLEKNLASLKEGIEDAIEIKKKMVYIGRGWVKAGFKLDSIKNEDLVVEHRNDSSFLTLHIDSAQILNLDINPYYIQTPKLEIYGYELFMSKGRGGVFSEKEHIKVKLQCKQNLLNDALKKGLMEQATTSGVATLVQFFKLLNFDDVNIVFKKPQTEIDLNLSTSN